MADVKAWHFTGDTLRNGDPLPRKGVWLKYDGEVVMCESGLHASRRLIDALQYAPGSRIHRVECADIVEEQGDKLVCRRRRIVASVDGEVILKEFARYCARSVLHLWDAPRVVKDYLRTGDESLRATARATAGAASGAAWDAAWATSGDAAGDAARATARAASGDAAGAAARATARATAGAAPGAKRNHWLTRRVLKEMKNG